MKFTREQVIEMAAETDLAEARDDVSTLPAEYVNALSLLCTIAADRALEAAAVAFEQHNRTNRQWVDGSLWGNLTNEGCARIRAMKEPAQ